MRLKVGTGIGLAMLLVLFGAASDGLLSDIAVSVTVLLTLGVTFGVVRWAGCSLLVHRLIVWAMLLLLGALTLDIVENFQVLDDIPVVGDRSPWNGRLSSIGAALGFVLTFAALTFALIESQMGRVAQQRYGLLAENISDVIFTADLNLACSYISPSVTRLRGYTVEEALAQRSGEGMTPDSYARARQLVDSERERVRLGLRRPEEPATIDLELVRKDGTTLWAETTVSFLLDEHGEVSGILGVTRDITERKRAEDADRQLNERLTLAIRAGNLAVWDWDLGTNELACNQRMYEMFGIEPSCPDIAFAWRTALAPEDFIRTWAELRAAIDEGREFHSQFRVIHPDGAMRHIESRATVRRGDDDKPLRVIGMNADITERIDSEAERVRLQEQLNQAQKLESIGRLAGGVAHDFNNMLLVILGHAELALESAGAGDELQGHVDEIRNAALRSADLTRQLLAFARQQAITPKVFDVNVVMDPMLSMLRRLIGEDVRLSWCPGIGLWRIKMDPSQMDQILANLCVNARDAIDGVGEIRIQTSNVTLDATDTAESPEIVPGDYVRLTISDNGCGMSRETLARIYEPFFTTKKLGRGTGLGLASVYGIVKQNHGFITVASKPAHGTSFTIYLPRCNDSASSDTKENLMPAPVASGRETILLVEDEQAIRLLAETLLRRLGYTVLVASAPGEAVRLLDTRLEHIHLLLTDIVMPDMNGRDLAALVKARRPGIKHLYMSGYTADLGSLEEILREGSNFIQKPFRMKELAEKVRQVLDEVDDPSGR